MKRSLSLLLVLLLLLPCGPRAIAEDSESEGEIVIVTEPPVPEETPLPKETPEPTLPEETPIPTETPTPTEAPAPTDTPEPTPTVPVLPTSIEIDTENWYFGMDCAYRDGYQPTIENEIVTIVLPLQSTDLLLDDKITVTPDLSATGTTFVIANYQKTVSLSQQRINGTEETREIFYVDFSIPLSPSRVNGSYPVRLQVKAYDLNYTPIETVFTVYVNITDVPPKPTNTGGAETPTAEPVVLIAHRETTPEIVMAETRWIPSSCAICSSGWIPAICKSIWMRTALCCSWKAWIVAEKAKLNCISAAIHTSRPGSTSLTFLFPMTAIKL